MHTFILVCMILASAVEGWLISLLVRHVLWDARERGRRRSVLRRSAAIQDAQARQSARQLSAMAWQARQRLYDLEQEGHASRHGYPVRSREH
jgi:hypothetical protein